MPWNVRLPGAEYYGASDPGLPAVVAEAMQQKLIAIDTETTGLEIWKAMPLFFSMAWGHRRFCFPADVLPKFRALFDDPEREWVFANAKFDLHMLANAGAPIAGKILDTQVMHALLYEESPHSLDYMGEQLLKWSWKDMFDEWDKRLEPNVGDFILGLFQRDPTKLIEYASNDAHGTLQIFWKLKEELQDAKIHSLYPTRFQTLWDYFYKVEVPFTRVLWKCERNGILIDSGYLQDVSDRVGKDLAQIERDITRLVGRVINMNSPTQMRDYFFKEKGYRPIGYSKGGKTGVKLPQVNWDFLDHYSAQDDVARLMLQHRDLSKLKGTYADGLPRFFDAHGRIHTRFNQDVARTGRLSSADPNLQNIPNAEMDKHRVRAAFIAPPGHNLVCFDYQALEMRLLAAAAMEKDMIDIFLKGWDIHMGNASLVFGLPYDDIKAAKKKDKHELSDYDRRCLKARSDVKTIGFGLNYGMQAPLLAKNMQCSVPEAEDLMARYMDRYPAVKQFYAEAIEETRACGYAFTVLGRRRFLPEIASKHPGDVGKAERQAVNMQIQGTAADAAKMAMILIDDAQLDRRFGCRMLLQVHDEIVFECPEETCDEAMAEIQQWMEHPFPTDLAVPLTVSGDKAKNWADAK